MTDVDNYLVTAAHVAKKTSLNTDIVIKSKDDTPQKFKLQKIVMNKDTLSWTEHPNADVAAIQLDRSNIPEEIMKISLPFGFIFHQLKAPFREREVTVFGYPMSLGIGKKISPITKTLKPSSGLIDLLYGTNSQSTFYLLDDPGVSGFSSGV
ncbi:MAG: trypsin-like serine protease [Calditrichia bacterium]|nr:trypsin-like serine protease [Calditrichia bacterium]